MPCRRGGTVIAGRIVVVSRVLSNESLGWMSHVLSAASLGHQQIETLLWGDTQLQVQGMRLVEALG